MNDNDSIVSNRPDLAAAIERAWTHVSGSGTWFTGIERLAIAEEVRAAKPCSLCRARKAALSPYAVTGDHEDCGKLPSPVIEVVHRVSTDSGRLTESWYRSMLDAGISDAEYVEVIGIIAIIMGLDTLDRALGCPPHTLPKPHGGMPSRARPAGAAQTIAWVPTLEPDDVTADDLDPYPFGAPVNIHRALSLVPAEVRAFFDLDFELYMPQAAIRDFDHDLRALDHPQIELLAGRTSYLNDCFY